MKEKKAYVLCANKLRLDQKRKVEIRERERKRIEYKGKHNKVIEQKHKSK